MPVQLHPAWKQAAATITATYTYGDVITKSQLCLWFNIVFPQTGSKETFNKLEFKFMKQMSELKDELLFVNKIFLHSVGQSKYKLIKPGDQTSTAWKDFIRKFTKIAQLTNKRLANLNTTNLSSHQLADNTNKRQALAAIVASSSKRIANATTNQQQSLPNNRQTTNPQPGSSTNPPGTNPKKQTNKP